LNFFYIKGRPPTRKVGSRSLATTTEASTGELQGREKLASTPKLIRIPLHRSNSSPYRGREKSAKSLAPESRGKSNPGGFV